MRIIFVTIMSWLTYTLVYSQQLLLIEKLGVVSIVDVNSYRTSGFYEEGNFTVQNKLCNTDGGHFVGYNWGMDSLIIYLNNAGKVTFKKCLIDSVLQNQVLSEVILTTDVYMGKRRYKTGNTEIFFSSNGDIDCYRNSRLLWKKESNNWGYKLISFGNSLFKPVISNSEEFVLLTNNKSPNSLIEIDLETGREKVIDKGVCDYYYSPNDKSILVAKPDVFYSKYFLFKKDTQESMELYGVTKAFWLLR